MVIGEQLNQQQQAQQQIATHRIAATVTTTQQHHRRNSSNSAVAIAQQHQLQQQQQQQPVSVLSATIPGLNGNNSGQSNAGNSGIGVGFGVLSNNSNNNGCNNANNVVVVGGGLVGGGTSAAAAKNQLEQLNTMREALFSQEGWGCQHVNQDTNWEVPSSPEPSNKDPSGGPPMWKPNVNNGTDLWESNLRNGGQPPPQPAQKTPWGHTPSSNLGGTWGEDDDGTDSSNVWTGTSANPSASGGVGVGGVPGVGVGVGATSVGGGPQWGQGNVGNVAASGGGNSSNAAANNMGNIVGAGGSSTGNSGVGNAGGVNVSGVAGSTGNTGGNGWGDPRDIRSGPMVPIDIRNVDPRDAMRAASSGDPRDLRMIDPRDPIRGDPRGISGRLNGTSEMWGNHHPVTHGQIPLNKMVGPGGNAAANVAVAAVAGGIGAGVGGISGPSGVGGNVNAQWGAAQSVVGPKDIASMTGKQTSGWEEPSPPPQRRNIPNYDDGTSLWGQQSRVPGGGSHWKEMSDPMNRSHLIRSAIASQNTANAGVGGLNAGGGGGLGVPGAVGVGVTGNPNNPMGGVGGVGPQGRLGVGSAVGPPVGGQLKPDTAMWMHASAASGSGRNAGSWGDDGSHNVAANSGANWGDEKPAGNISQLGASVGVSGGNAWTDSSAVAAWNKNPTKLTGGTGSGGWGAASSDTNDLANDWAHSSIVGKSQQKIGGVGIGVGGINSEIIKNSKQYRMLVDTGYKKDDVERALINANMNIEEAADILRTNATMTIDSWRRHDESLVSYGDHSNAGGGFPSRYPSAGSQPTIPFPSNNNLLNNMGNAVSGGGNNPGLNALNSMQPLHVQKFLNQGPHNVAGGPQSVNTAVVAFGQGANVAAAAVNAASNSSGQPSAQQLRMLVQQIQLAVHSGYLSSQILNQPLAPATLLLLNQLLSNIKHLQGAQQSLARGNNATNMQFNVTIAKYKQQIQNLQNQINAQQTIYIKQQQQNLQQNPQQHPGSSHVGNSNAEYLRGQHDAINALQGNFSEINLNKPGGYQGTPNQQSRLNQWKLPVLEKEVTSDSTDFSRAPGATKQSLSSANANSMGPLGMQGDGTWSTGRNIGDGWPDPSNDNENKDWSVAQPSSATAYTDLVQEFEPGKPWKGSQIKSIEDDPSITPGSVARSPLSINPTPKEADIFANTSKSSPTDLPPLSLSSSTWSFNPSSSNQNFPSWSDNPQQCTTSELWASPMNKASRGPPPGLGSNKSGVGSVPNVVSVSNPSAVSGNSNGWIVGGRGHNANPTWTGTNSSWNSNWLLLKNLSSQIDGSTLRTLCMQHGPISTFHLYLKLGIALCKYATREEANKAQMTLNNCVLGNTTICAESPSENEMQNILQHLPSQGSNQPGIPGAGNNGGGGGNNGNGGNSGNGGSNMNNASNVSGNGSGGSNGGNSNNSNTGAGNNVIPGNVNNSSNGVSDVGGSNCNNTGVNGAGGSNNSGAQSQSGTAVGSNINNSNGGNSSNTVGNGGTGGSVNANPVGVGVNNAVWRQTQNQHQHQNQSRQTDAWNTGSVWQTANPNNSLWAAIDVSGSSGGSSSGVIAPERGTPSNLKSYLPENLLELN